MGSVEEMKTSVFTRLDTIAGFSASQFPHVLESRVHYVLSAPLSYSLKAHEIDLGWKVRRTGRYCS